MVTAYCQIDSEDFVAFSKNVKFIAVNPITVKFEQ